MTDNYIEPIGPDVHFDRKSWLIGLMFRHFPQLRSEQILTYSAKEMEELLKDKGINLD